MKDPIDQDIKKLMKGPPINWEVTVRNLGAVRSASHIQRLSRGMDSDTIRMAFLAEYVSVRLGATGCGEKSHEDAVKFANRRVRKVAKALGYAYPEQQEIHI